MRTSTAASLLFAGLAVASPLMQAIKKDLIVDVITDVVWVTVTDGTTIQAPATSVPVVTVTDDVTAEVTSAPAPAAVDPHIPAGFTVDSLGNLVPCSSTEAAATPSVVSSTSVAPAVVVTVELSTSEVPTPTPTTSVAPAVVEPVETSSTVAAATSSLDASDATSTDPILASLYHHNVHRTNHSVSFVEWNDTLASYAATVAASCVYAHNLTPGGGGYGQNIAVFGETGDVASLGEAHEIASASTDMWYNGEVNSFLPSYYGLENPDFSNFDAWGHFSQMVWKATEEIGCASQFCDAGTIFSGFGSWFTVCNYGPEGNMGGEYGANVLKPLGQDTVTV